MSRSNTESLREAKGIRFVSKMAPYSLFKALTSGLYYIGNRGSFGTQLRVPGPLPPTWPRPWLSLPPSLPPLLLRFHPHLDLPVYLDTGWSQSQSQTRALSPWPAVHPGIAVKSFWGNSLSCPLVWLFISELGGGGGGTVTLHPKWHPITVHYGGWWEVGRLAPHTQESGNPSANVPGLRTT